MYKVDAASGKELYVIPRVIRKSVVIKNHDLDSHFGVYRTVSRILKFYYFPGIRRYVKRHIASCIKCIFAKNKNGSQADELHPIPVEKDLSR